MQGHGKKAWPQFYEDARFVEYREYAATWMRNQLLKCEVVEVGGGGDFILPFDGVRAILALRFNAKRPVSYPKRIVDNTKKPDVDNYAKMTMDAIVDARILKDDAFITDLIVKKRYACDEHPEGVEVDLTVFPTET